MARTDHFGEWLRQRIAAKLMTQSQFAEASKIPLATVTWWIKNARPPQRPLSRARLAHALEMSQEEFDEAFGCANAGCPLSNVA
ncbi:MAG TPA: helix-turn-helix transcriptional regulator [Tepidisphaeraceae bacterium]|nr:helix-turn-helix transcriptional regulator [Tepidisphaeraceae bacterium]